MKFFSLEDAINAKERIKDFVIETPLIHSEYFSKNLVLMYILNVIFCRKLVLLKYVV